MKIPSTCNLLLFAIAFFHISGNVGQADVSGVGAISEPSATSDAAATTAPTATSTEIQPTPTSEAAQEQQSTQAPSDTGATISPTTSTNSNEAAATTPSDNKNDHQTTGNDQSQTSQASQTTNNDNNSPDKTSSSNTRKTDEPSSSDPASGGQGDLSGSTQKDAPKSNSSTGNNSSGNKGPDTGVIVGAVIGGVAGIAVIGALAIWLIRRSGGNNRRNQGFQYQPDDYTTSMSGTGAAPVKSSFRQQQARPFIPPASTGYANLGTVQPDERYNNYQHYHDKPEERDMGADYYNTAQQQPGYYYYPNERTAEATCKPDEPTVQHKPNAV